MIFCSFARNIFIWDLHLGVKALVVIRSLSDAHCFVAHEFKKAADLYTQALDYNPFDATLWCNRAYTRIKLEEHGYALSDASTDAFHLTLLIIDVDCRFIFCG